MLNFFFNVIDYPWHWSFVSNPMGLIWNSFKLNGNDVKVSFIVLESRPRKKQSKIWRQAKKVEKIFFWSKIVQTKEFFQNKCRRADKQQGHRVKVQTSRQADKQTNNRAIVFVSTARSDFQLFFVFLLCLQSFESFLAIFSVKNEKIKFLLEKSLTVKLLTFDSQISKFLMISFDPSITL